MSNRNAGPVVSLATHWPELSPSPAIYDKWDKGLSSSSRSQYISELLYNPERNKALVDLLSALAAGDAALGDWVRQNYPYETSPRSVVADIVLSYGHAICDLGKTFNDINHYSEPIPKISNPMVLPAKFSHLNNTMPVDISFIPMISQNIEDTEAGRNIQDLYFSDNNTNQKAKIKYKPDSGAVKAAICNMISKYGWDVHANINMLDSDIKAPIGVLPVFNIDQLTRACKRLLMLANANKWDYILLPYVETPCLPWDMVRGVYNSILDGRFIIADESLATESNIIAKTAGKMLPACCAVGHKPNDMFKNGAYSISTWRLVNEKLKACIKQLITEHSTRKFISGGAQGIEQLFCPAVREVSDEIGIECETWVYEPFKSYSDKWPDSGLFSKYEYKRLVSTAKQANTLKQLNPSLGSDMDKKAFAKALHEKDIKMVRDSNVIIGVFKHDIKYIQGNNPPEEIRKSSTYKTLQHAYDCGKALIIIHPESLATTRLNF